MTKKSTSKIIKKESGKFVKVREKIQKGLVKGHRRSAHDGFSMEIPPKKPIETKPKNEDEKKE